jgi:hypothetical protein
VSAAELVWFYEVSTIGLAVSYLIRPHWGIAADVCLSFGLLLWATKERQKKADRE